MSRYACYFLVNLSPDRLRLSLQKVLAVGRLEAVHEGADYVMAREIPGQVAFAKLVTVEVSIDVTTATSEAVKLSFLVRNEELPLQLDNHCRQVFDALRLAIAHCPDWHPINSSRSLVASPALN
ncbi:hypothetical protein [Chamaesiphon sp. VAR_69_metabat_338]|uniref:hypothetical protein n=1 Tax=Chamaesiphon sp. VAR_69_metabat_338 TaxID=2964704 RepID=UPI00286DC85D|nr:hypothetical protein [Chamaesiphon sp. VAR_69_metabat_338]